MRGKCSMAAVIRPVGIYYAYLRDRRISVLRITEILLQAHEIVYIHRQRETLQQRFKLCLVHPDEACHRLYRVRHFIVLLQCLGQRQRCLSRLDGIDDEALDTLYVRLGDVTVQHIELRRAHIGSLSRRQQLYALRRGVCSLVELPRQSLHRKYRARALHYRRFIDHIQLRLAQNRPLGILEELIVDPLDVVSVDDPDRFYGIDAQK